MGSSLRISTCVVCGDVFESGKRGPLGVACRACQRDTGNAEGRAERAQRARPRRRIDSGESLQLLSIRWAGSRRADRGWYVWTTPAFHGPPRPCLYCGEPGSGRRHARVCRADECQRQYNNARMRAYMPGYTKTPTGREIKRRRDARRRAQKRGVVRVDYLPAEIFARDRWVCQLCRRKVDQRLAHPHRMSASIDHMIPISLQGDDAPWNVQLAHLGCNSSKKASAANDQLRLTLA